MSEKIFEKYVLYKKKYLESKSINNDARYATLHFYANKTAHKIDRLLSNLNLSRDEITKNKDIIKTIQDQNIKKSYGIIVDENKNFIYHKIKKLINTNMNDLHNQTVGISYFDNAIKNDEPTFGLFNWIDGEEKYVIVIPLLTKTRDGLSLFYAHTIYIKDIQKNKKYSI